MNTYGVLDKDGCHIDVSKTELGAKQYATRHNYTMISVRHNCGYVATRLAYRTKGKWVKFT